MPPRRAKPTAEPALDLMKITSLDQNSLQNIFKCLPGTEQETLASAHPMFLGIYRNIVVSAENYLGEVDLEEASQVLANYPNLSSVTLRIERDEGLPSLHDLKGSPKINALTLLFVMDVPTRRSLSALPANFPNLRSLSLQNEFIGNRMLKGWKDCYFNLDGNLRVLSSLRNLQELEVNNLFSDEGFQHLTNLTRLSIAFPALQESYPEQLYCHGCESIHLDDTDDLNIYQRSIPWRLGINLGKHIGTLPKLKELIVDFETTDKDLSYSGVINRFYLREPASSGAAGGSRRAGAYNRLNDNIHAEPPEPLYFQNLEEIEFRNCGGPEHFLYTPSMHRRIRYPSEGLACNDLWHTCVIWESMKNFPRLRKWRLMAFDGGLDDGVESIEVNWPCACGCGTVTGQVVERDLLCHHGKRTFVEIDRPEALVNI